MLIKCTASPLTHLRNKCILEHHQSRGNARSYSVVVQHVVSVLNRSLDWLWLPTDTAPLFQKALYLLSHRHCSEAKKHVCVQGFHEGSWWWGGNVDACWTSHVAGCKLYLLLLHHAGKSWYKCLKYSATVCILSLFSSHALVASWCSGSSRGLGHQVLQENWREGDQQVEEVVNHLAFGWETLTLVRGLIGTLRKEGWSGGLLLLFPSRNRNARWCLRDCRRCMAA